MSVKRTVLILALLAITALPAMADPILIFNTGVDGASAVLPGASVDPHWTLDGGPAIVASLIPAPWLANDAVSKWIAPASDATVDFGFDIFTYATTFDLTGLIPSTAFLSLRWASDNQTIDVRLNGATVTGFVTNCADSVSDTSCFTAFDPLAITSGFLAGTNTLEFVVKNGDPGPAGDGPSGLRVEIVSATAEASPVPEPSSLLLLAGGLLVASARGRRPRA